MSASASRLTLGIDTALVEIESLPDGDVAITLKSYREAPVPAALRARLLSLCRPGAETTLDEVCDLNFELGEVFASAVAAAGEAGLDLSQVDLVASHGQTLWHTPVAVPGACQEGGRRLATLQMAESAVIAQRTGLTVADNFRVAELAAGRQGAPLSGFFEAAMLRHPTKLRVSQNIGGMGNASVVAPASVSNGYFAFDTGPGNVLIDCAVRVVSGGREEYDAGGARATRGEASIDREFAETWLSETAYLARAPPKTTGRELFSEAMGRDIVERLRARGADDDGVVATVTYMTAESIVRALQSYVDGEIDELFVCGGGAHNLVLMRHLAHAFPSARVAPLDELKGGVPAAAKEAVMFALLGFLCVSGRQVPVSSVEDAKGATVMGKVTPGPNYRDIIGRAVQDDAGMLRRIVVRQA